MRPARFPFPLSSLWGHWLLPCCAFKPFCFMYLGERSHLSNSVLNFHLLLTAFEQLSTLVPYPCSIQDCYLPSPPSWGGSLRALGGLECISSPICLLFHPAHLTDN